MNSNSSCEKNSRVNKDLDFFLTVHLSVPTIVLSALVSFCRSDPPRYIFVLLSVFNYHVDIC